MEASTILDMEDLDIVLNALPDNWQKKAFELKALTRKRSFDSAETLFQTLMLHLAQGLSLRTTSAVARETGLVNVSDVAIQYRLRISRPWLEWMCKEMVHKSTPPGAKVLHPEELSIRYADGTLVEEEGKTGTKRRIHYLISMPDYRCEQMHVTDTKVGESFERFSVEPNDVLVGDRGFCRAKGIRHVLEAGGQVIVRLHHNAVKLCEQDGKHLDIIDKLQSLRTGEIGQWPMGIRCNDNHIMRGRLCAIRKQPDAIERSRRQVRQCAKKNGYTPSKLTLQLAEYVLVFTTIDEELLEASTVLEIYRGRWQIELVFKRLKSLAQMGQIPKYVPEVARAWLQGKLLISLIVEFLLGVGESFFPWGYPISSHKKARTFDMERV